MTQFTPVNGFVLIRKVKTSFVSRTGLILPEAAERNSLGETVGVVLALPTSPQRVDRGDWVELIHPEEILSVGDIVVHRGYLRHATALGDRLGEETHDAVYLVKVSDIYGVVTPKEDEQLRMGSYGEYEVS